MNGYFTPAIRKFAISLVLFLILLPLSRAVSPRAIIEGNDIFLVWMPLSAIIAMLYLFGRAAVPSLFIALLLFFPVKFHLSTVQLLVFIGCVTLPVLVACTALRIILGRAWRFAVPLTGLGVRLFWLGFFAPCSVKLCMYLAGKMLDFPPVLNHYFGNNTPKFFSIVDVMGLVAAALLFPRLFYYPLRMLLNPRFARAFWRASICPMLEEGRRSWSLCWVVLLATFLIVLCWYSETVLISGYLVPLVFVLFTVGIRLVNQGLMHLLWAFSAWLLLTFNSNFLAGVANGGSLAFILSVFISFTVCLFYMTTIYRKSEWMQSNYYRQSETDPLTLLPNLRALERHLADYPQGALCCLQMSNLEFLSRHYGIVMRIYCKRNITQTLQPWLHEGERVFQIPGCELLIFLRGPEIQARLSHMVDLLSTNKIHWNGHEIDIEYGASWGVVNHIQPDDLQQRLGQLSWLAEQACADNRVQAMDQNDQEMLLDQSSERVYLLRQVTRTLDEGRLRLYAQPILDRNDKGYREILCRIFDDSGQMIMPDRFIPVVAEFNLSARFDMRILAQLLEWLRCHPSSQTGARFSVNLMPLTLMQKDIAGDIIRLFEDYGVMPEAVIIEVTEAQAFSDDGVSHRNIALLRSRGFRIAIDDFGTGYANYGRLKDLDADIIKIDGCFVRDILNGPLDSMIVRSICEMAQAKSMTVVAEFVENSQQRDLLLSLGVDYLQGWLIGKPEPLEA
ncbi:sensor domain-containing phosphodiesterase [Enterobacteriaceae bacterium BIT-l23]|nr:sensor domain-containing phosphodiesterase [Enterobacteriaceae bacterium BIT-l23]